MVAIIQNYIVSYFNIMLINLISEKNYGKAKCKINVYRYKICFSVIIFYELAKKVIFHHTFVLNAVTFSILDVQCSNMFLFLFF